MRHRDFYWSVPGDIWSTFRDAHMIAWGSISYSYSAGTSLVTLPGYAVLVAPIAAISSRLGLVDSAPVVFLAKPTTWLLLGPFVLATALVPLVALDKVAERLPIGKTSRHLLLLGEAVVLWPVTTIWGHPEDLLALGFTLLAMIATFDGKLPRAGWLLGAAMAMQLLVVLFIPIMLAIAGRRRLAPLLLRASLLPGCLALAVLVPDFHDSWHALTSQPNYPTVNHPTPWVLLSPHIAHNVVAAGPGRLVGVAVAVGCGFLALRHRTDLRWVLWLSAGAMAARCVFEAVVDPYYLAPAIALAATVAFSNRRSRAIAAVLTGGFATVITYWHANMWIWWLEMTVPLLLMLWASYPSGASAPPPESITSAEEIEADSAVPELASP